MAELEQQQLPARHAIAQPDALEQWRRKIEDQPRAEVPASQLAVLVRNEQQLSAVLHEDESFPGSDIDLVNEATGEVQAKGHFLRDGMRPVKPWPRPKWAFCETNPFFWSRQNGHFAKRTHFFGAANMSILRNEPIFLEPPK